MIELLIVACLAHGACRDFALLYDAREVSLMTCVARGQVELARWKQSHPHWRVMRWRCGLVAEGVSSI
jgi:hypothetical protein